MKKKIVAVALCTLVLALCSPVDAQQQEKIARIGFLTGSPLSSEWKRNESFRQGLRDLGYVEGKNVVIDLRSYEGKRDRQRTLVAELVRSNVDVIVAVGSGDIRAAKEGTSTIPIVMLTGGDPVASGFVASLARPGGNVTGLATLRAGAKRKTTRTSNGSCSETSRAWLFSRTQRRAKIIHKCARSSSSLPRRSE